LSPRVRARMEELQLTNADLAGIPPTGAGNRVTIKDLENFLHKIENQQTEEASAIRAGVADAMRRSWTRPLSTIGSSVNLDPVLRDRQSRDSKPGPGLYALRALALALAQNPTAAAKLIGSRVVQSNSIDVGIAVEAEDGIMVPVIRSAEKRLLPILRRNTRNLSILRGNDEFRPTCNLAASRLFQTSAPSEWNGAPQFHYPIKHCCSASAWERKFLRGMKIKKSLFPRPRRRSR